MEADRAPRGYRGTAGRVLLEAGLIAGAWLLFAGNLHRQDLVVATVVGLAGASAGAGLRRRLEHRPASPGAWLPLLPSVIAGVLRDSWIVTRAFLDLVSRRREVGGTVGEQPFVHHDRDGGERPSEAATRRILATVVATAQPNSIVIGFDRDRDVVVLHVLRPSRHPAVERRLTGPR